MSWLQIAILVESFVLLLGALIGISIADQCFKARARRQARSQRDLNAQWRALQGTQARYRRQRIENDSDDAKSDFDVAG
jgi:hypothetical protein